MAVALLDRLESSPYALRLLVRLSKCEALRDAVLDQSPDFLDSALRRACADTAHSVQLSDLCVTFLRVRLPAPHILPASAEDFFLHVFNAAIKKPCLTTLLPIHALLDGACEVLMDILPRNSLDHLRDELVRMMRSVKTVEDQVLTLLCLAILIKVNKKHVIPTEQDLSSSFSVLTTQETSSSYDHAESLFCGERGAKTMHLVALQVIYVCGSNGVMVTSLDAAAHVRVATVVAKVIQQDVRLAWARKNAKIVNKLQEKMMAPALGLTMQIEAIAFATLLSDAKAFSLGALVKIEDLLLSAFSSPSKGLSPVVGALIATIEFFAYRLTTPFWSGLIQQLLERLPSGNETSAFQSVLIGLKQLMLKHDPIRIGLLQAAASKSMDGPFARFFRSPVSTLTNVHRTYQVSLISLLLAC